MRFGAALIAGVAALALAAPAQADTWTVTDGSSDATTPACNATAHTCLSLRLAIAASEATKDVPDVINVPAGTININNDLVIQSDITVNGVSARTNIIDGGAKYRGFRIAASGDAKVNHFTIRNAAAGQAGSTDGGGVLNMGGVAQLDFVHVTTSRADNGAGIANLQGGRTSVQHSLIDGNIATGDGGGIVSVGGLETTPITLVVVGDSTVFGNIAGPAGTGGVSSRNNGGLLSILRSTIADNTGGTRGVGGVFTTVAARAQVAGSILARNLVGTATVNCGAVKPTDGGSNVEDNDTCGFNFTGNPGLDTKLANAGGETNVLPIAPTSPAVDRLPVATNCAAGTPDQRGLYRPQGTACDSGAYELDQAATLTITGGPSGTIATDSVQFDFSSSEPGADPVCQLTGPGQPGGFVTCYKSNAQPYAGLANGTYTFSVRDGAFPGSPPATRTFTVAALDTTINSGPNGPTNDTTPTFTFTGSGGATTFQCRVDSGQFATCASPFTTAALAPGAHTFEVRALNAAGAADTTPASRAFTIDTTAPNTNLTPFASPSSDNTPTFSFTSEAGATFECRLDAATFAVCTSPLTAAALPDGRHTFEVRAKDAAGNVDGTPAAQVFVIDTGVPDTTIDDGPSAATNDATPTFTFSSEAGATFRCRIDGAPFATCASPFTVTALADGPHTFEVQATDANLNVDGTPASRAFTVDTAPPPAPDVSGPQGPTTNASPQFNFNAAEATATECRLDGPTPRVGEFGPCTSPKGFGSLAPGDYVFFVRSTDAAGNTQITQRAFTVTIPQQATPTPTPTPSATPTPTPGPVENQSVGARPVSGTVLVRLPGSKVFVGLVPSVIKNGAEFDTRNGVVEITRADGGVARFYAGIFKLSQSGGYTVLTLTEKLTGCPKAKKSSASAAAKKPKTRKLWGDGKGKFRTKGQYSAATVRGTKWLVQDTCTTTLTRVVQGVVEVNDFVKKKKALIKKGKRYIARPKKK